MLDAAQPWITSSRVNVTFVAPELQFIPKTVEVQSEREQLVFRVKLKGAPAVYPARLAVNVPPSEQAAQ